MKPSALSVVVLSASILPSCGRPQPETTPFTWLGDTATTTTVTITDTDPPTTTTVQTTPKVWTAGPELPDCTASPGDPDRVALSGVVLLPSEAVAGHVVVDRSTGLIECAGASCDIDGATVVCTEGVISPALIDTHDHTQYNVLGPWRHGELFEDRYDWQSDGDYWDFRTSYDEMEDAYTCEIVKWAELRHIVTGSTSVVGSSGGECIDVLARNLDEDEASHGIADYYLRYSSGRVTSYDAIDAADRADDLATGFNDVFLDHVAEGVGGSVTDEIDLMFDLGMVGPGSIFVHATDASIGQLAQMSATATGLVWSPRSNLDLYADTTKADLAARLGVPMAIGPDWTWSGSNSVTGELSCAYDWLSARGSELNDVDIWQLATLDAAVLLELQGHLGMLVEGAKADIAVFAYSDEPYRAVIEAGYTDVLLVLIDGNARYGLPYLMDNLEENPLWCESVEVCGEYRGMCAAEGDKGTDAQKYTDLEATLAAALAATPMPQGLEYAGELYPLWACEEDRGTCDPRNPTPTDVDGDGINDDIDSCPAAFDPTDTDTDSDGTADVCDPCPLSPEPDCTFDPNDLDGDGVPNASDGCSWIYDPGNPDADSDGRPDACDPCPELANPGNLGCPATIRALRDPTHPDHPDEGTEVTISDVVVTAVSDNDFFVQDPAEPDFGGLYVFGASASVGDLVDVTGDYVEYYGLTELASPTVEVKGTAPVPPPIVIADPCDVGTNGGDAERYESMLVSVGPVTVTDENPDAPDDFNEFEVGGCLRIDDLLCEDCWVEQPGVDTNYSQIVGPMTYSFSERKLVPRTQADLVP